MNADTTQMNADNNIKINPRLSALKSALIRVEIRVNPR
jgi:hypothetical protein